MTGLYDSCCAQVCILFAFTKARDLKIHLSLRCELTTSQQKHFSTRISLPATHQGLGNGLIKDETLRLLRTNSSETTFHENIRQFKSHLHERGYPDTPLRSETRREESRHSNKKNRRTRKFYLLSHNTGLNVHVIGSLSGR